MTAAGTACRGPAALVGTGRVGAARMTTAGLAACRPAALVGTGRASGATPDGQGEALSGLAVALRLVAGPAARAGLLGAPATGGAEPTGTVTLGAWEPRIAPCAARPDAASARGVLAAAG